VLLSGIFFAWKVGQIFRVTSTLSADGDQRTYTVLGQVFFATADEFTAAFDFGERVRQVRIDVTHAHLWDITAVAALDKVVMKLRQGGTLVEIIGLNDASATIVDTLALHDKADAGDVLLAH
jgi:SulP family sulfate permease